MRQTLLVFIAFLVSFSAFAGETFTDVNSKVTVTIPDGYVKAPNFTASAPMFTGPMIDGHLMSIHINTFPIPVGVPIDIMYDTNLTQYQANPQYQNVQGVMIANAKAMSAEEKAKASPTELHREHLFLWTTGYQTNILVGGSYAGMQKSKPLIQALFASPRVAP